MGIVSLRFHIGCDRCKKINVFVGNCFERCASVKDVSFAGVEVSSRPIGLRILVTFHQFVDEQRAIFKTVSRMSSIVGHVKFFLYRAIKQKLKKKKKCNRVKVITGGTFVCNCSVYIREGLKIIAEKRS